MIENATYVANVICLAYMLGIFALYSVLIIFSGLDNSIRSRESLAEDFEALGRSRFTVPISVIVPVFNEAAVVAVTIRSLLALDYPEFELIIVDDGSTDKTFEILSDELHLESHGYFERRVVESGPVLEVHRSLLYDRVRVVRKANRGTKADACNCGLNFARYRYVCMVDGDTVYEPDALLNAARIIVPDPSTVIGVTGHIAVASHPETTVGARAEDREFIDATLLSNFQHLEYLRSFLNNRLAWSRMGFMLCASGAFAVWRRDVLEEVGGFSPDFSSEDIELTFRIHEHMRKRGIPYRIVSLPKMVARTEAPASIRSLVAQRVRWQRVTLETLWHYRRMAFRPRYGVVGMVGVPILLVTEALAPAFELLGAASLVAGIALGTFSWQTYAVLATTMMFALAILTSTAVLLEDISTRAYRLRHLVRLIALGPIELIVYRPILVFARLRGTIGFLRGNRGWGKFERNVRAPASKSVS